MSDQFGDSYYFELQQRLQQIMVAIQSHLNHEIIELINGAINANECGIALEMISDALIEANSPIDLTIRDEIASLAAKMKMPSHVADQLGAYGTPSHARENAHEYRRRGSKKECGIRHAINFTV